MTITITINITIAIIINYYYQQLKLIPDIFLQRVLDAATNLITTDQTLGDQKQVSLLIILN